MKETLLWVNVNAMSIEFYEKFWPLVGNLDNRRGLGFFLKQKVCHRGRSKLKWLLPVAEKMFAHKNMDNKMFDWTLTNS